MKRYKVKVTPQAQYQMMEIRDYIAYQLVNPDAAKNTIRAIRDAVQKLDSMPDRVKPIEEEPWGSQGVRKILVNNYYAYFWIDMKAFIVHVIAVAYAGRDQKNVLNEIK